MAFGLPPEVIAPRQIEFAIGVRQRVAFLRREVRWQIDGDDAAIRRDIRREEKSRVAVVGADFERLLRLQILGDRPQVTCFVHCDRCAGFRPAIPIESSR